MLSPTQTSLPCTFRTEPRPTDIDAIRNIVASTGFFHDYEIDVAVELIEERLNQGEASGYHFIFADDECGRTIAYACYGSVPCTIGSYDLYWIAVHSNMRGGGIGRALMRRVEESIAASGGQRLYIETSSRPLYVPTQTFYTRCNYTQVARLADFYNIGDDKIIFAKSIAARGGGGPD